MSNTLFRRGWVRHILKAVMGASLFVGLLPSCNSDGDGTTEAEQLRSRGVLGQRRGRGRAERAGRKIVEKVNLAGLDVAVWRPETQGAAPLVIFSHGLNGCNTQSTFLTEALAGDGYLVLAINHKDAVCVTGRPSKPEEPLRSPQSWNDHTYDDRRNDVTKLIDALRSDRTWSLQIDWSRVGLAGHSLGGYTVLGLAGGWSSWRQRDIRAVLALSPWCEPYIVNGNLDVGIPVMYQGGTRDLGITPSIKRPGGCFSKTSSPAYFVEFRGAGHLAWSDLQQGQHELIVHYSLEFFDKHLRGNSGARMDDKLAGVAALESK